MKLFYTEKEMHKEIDRRLYEESERVHYSRKFENIERELYELRVAVEKAHARIDAMQGHTNRADMEVPGCLK